MIQYMIDEMTSCAKQLKKDGFDYPIEVITLVICSIPAVILLLLNMILYNSWPSKLCTSLLSLIPKTGDLRLPSNYRGIQIQPLFSSLFDKIISNRLIMWTKVNDEQTAFQKGKGTLNQIFILRCITALAKYNKITLYIGFLDLSKAFDRVSRYLLLKTLVRLGIGNVMFNVLKRMYSNTRCVLKGFGKVSEVFEMYSGIRQGLSSSVILFIVFLDDVIDNLKLMCPVEPLIDQLHCLLHADDTLILGTDRDLFIKKCDILMDLFHLKRMTINFKKSGYMIINGKKRDIKCNLRLKAGFLTYRQSHKYLGVIITDSGIVKDDVKSFLAEKNKHVLVKLANYQRKNDLAPIAVKLKVVRSCINASLTYGSEAWGNSPLNGLEVLQRKALKIILNVRNSTPNEIVYIESGYIPLKPVVYKRQLKFFRKMKHHSITNPSSPISRIFEEIMTKKMPFIKHYKKLDEKFASPNECYNFYLNEEENTLFRTIRDKGDNDIDGCLGTYLRINPNLISPPMYEEIKSYQ